MNNNQIIAKNIYNKAIERFSDCDKKHKYAVLHGVRYALEMLLRETDSYDYLIFTEQIQKRDGW